MNQSWLKYLPGFLRDYLDGRHVFQKIIGNTSWLFTDQVVRMFLGFFVVIFMARYLGPEGFGKLNYAVALVALLVPFFRFGLDGLIVRDIVKMPQGVGELVGTVIFFRLVGAILACFATTILIQYLRPGDREISIMVFLITFGMVFKALDVTELWFRAELKSKYSVIVMCSAFIASSIFKIILVLTGGSLVYFAGAVLADNVIAGTGLVIIYILYGPGIDSLKVSFSRFKDIIKEGWPLIFAGISAIVHMEIDKIMLSNMMSDSEVGIYSAAVNISIIFYFLPIIIMQSSFSTLVKDREGNKRLYYVRLQQLFNVLALLAWFVVLAVVLLAPYIINVIYGIEFATASVVLSIHIFSGIFVFLGQARGVWIVAESFPLLDFWSNFFGAILNILLNLILIDKLGVIGAAWATLITYFFTYIGINVLFKRSMPIFIMQLKAMTLVGWFDKSNYNKV